MSEKETFQIRISADSRGSPKHLTIGELGVLLTGINRALNKSVNPVQNYSPQSQEPDFVKSEVVRVDNGSVILTVVTDFAAQGVIPAAIVGGIFGNAAYDFSKILVREVARALRRVSHDVQQEMVKVEPTLEARSGPDSSAFHSLESVQSAARLASDVQHAGGRTFQQKLSYSVAFEHQSGASIKVKFSAMSR